MNIKSYMRGIGAGMIVAALIMGISSPKKSSAVTVSNETLKETVASISSESTETVSKNETSVVINNEDNVSDILNKETDDTSGDNITTSIETGETSNDQTEKEQETETSDVSNNTATVTPPQIDPMPDDDTGYTDNGETVEIRIIKGDSSVSVSRRLFEAGLVESAVEFDKYLCENGYDKYICVGTYDISTGSDFETIAKIISRRN